MDGQICYMFILPVASFKPLCLKCNESMTLIKCVSVKQHCETKHLKSPVRERRITELRVQYDRSARLITHLFATQQHANTCALTDKGDTQTDGGGSGCSTPFTLFLKSATL